MGISSLARPQAGLVGADNGVPTVRRPLVPFPWDVTNSPHVVLRHASIVGPHAQDAGFTISVSDDERFSIAAASLARTGAWYVSAHADVSFGVVPATICESLARSFYPNGCTGEPFQQKNKGELEKRRNSSE